MAPPDQQRAPQPRAKVLEHCLIPPAPGSVAPSTLSLTFFDYVFLPFHPVQRVFFYELPCSRSLFLSDRLPHLKRSLSLALSEFRPLAGNLVLQPHFASPELHCTDGDAVAFTVAESGDDLNYLAGNHVRDAARLHPLVPPLLLLQGEGNRRAPVLALQVTLFPGVGVALGVTMQHAVADGSTSAHFLKTWAAMCRLGRKGVVGVECVCGPPSYDRTVIRDRQSLGRTFLSDLEMLKEDRRMEAWDLAGRSDIVRFTFVVTNEQIQQLDRRITGKTSLACSPYALACGFMWSCLVKARGFDGGGKKMEHFGFVTGCRARLDPPAPATYFGNCLGICSVEASRGDLVAEDGAVVASAAIWKVIRELETKGAFRGAKNWIRDVFRLAAMGILTVAGSPKLGLYQVDFGWGRPRKVEVVSIERTSAMSLAEAREEEGGGLELGLVLPRDDMERFAGFFADGLSQLSCSSP